MRLLTFIFFTLFAATSAAASGFSCLSWRLGVETNNIRDWATVPKSCADYMADYITGGQYLEDSKFASHQAFRYAKNLKLVGDGNDVWIFDVDETVFSHVAVFAKYRFGTEPFDRRAVMEYLKKNMAPALPESLKLYRKLKSLGIKIVFLTGRNESMREITESNLKNAGYSSWEKVLLRDSSNLNQTQKKYKSSKRTELVKSGYRIVGNIGDQWSDLLGDNPGNRTFKLPNPIYYAA